MATTGVLEFVGLRVMGEAVCRDLTLEQTATIRRLLEATAAAGWNEAYYTAVLRTIEKRPPPTF